MIVHEKFIQLKGNLLQSCQMILSKLAFTLPKYISIYIKKKFCYDKFIKA